MEKRERENEEEESVVVLTKRGKGNMVRPIVGEADDGFGKGGKKRKMKKVGKCCVCWSLECDKVRVYILVVG